MSALSEQGLRDLAAEIEALSPPDKLRFAADLLEHRKPDLAKTIIDKVGVELGAALMLARMKAPTP